jgi:AcrR family transcriptional regulator
VNDEPTNVADTNPTVERILDGALRALSRHGLTRVSMGDVSKEAGVSRGTVYRYFANRDQLLDAVGHHVQRGFEIGLDQAIAENPALDARVEIVLEFLTAYSKRPEIQRLEELQPKFVLDYLHRELPQYVRKLDDALRPALEQAESVRSGKVDPSFVSDLIIRTTMSNRLLGGADPDVLAKQLLSLWNALAGLDR